jgi:DNA-binding protein H-NS
MISNLNSARALIQADLDHAHQVLQLWQAQVAELEKALGQLDAVDASRDVLRIEYQGQKGDASMLGMDTAAANARSSGKRPGPRLKRGDARAATAQKAVPTRGPRKQRMSTANLAAAPGSAGDAPTPRRRGPGKKQKEASVKYRDRASGKTWSGRGRKPSWLRGDADQYLVSNLRSSNGGNPDAAEPANQANA